MAPKRLEFETQGERNSSKSQELLELRKGPTRATAFTRKLIPPSCDLVFTIFLA
jgi:hypothetical protein